MLADWQLRERGFVPAAVTARALASPLGWASLDGADWLPFAVEVDEQAELRALDCSVATDAGELARAAVQEFAEGVEIDVRSAVKQLRAGSRSRALDALERVCGVIETLRAGS